MQSPCVKNYLNDLTPNSLYYHLHESVLMCFTVSKSLPLKLNFILGRIGHPIVLKLMRKEAGGKMECSFLRLLSAQLSGYGRKHCRAAVTIHLALWRDIYFGLLPPRSFQNLHVERVVDSLSSIKK